MAGASRLERERWRLLAVDMLRAARSFHSLRELSAATGLDPSVLSRYATGQMLPSHDTALAIVERLRSHLDLPGIVLGAATSPGGFIYLERALSRHDILRLVTIELYLRLRERGVKAEKVLVPEAGGVVLAAALAQLLEADVVVARKSKGDPSREYYEAHVVSPPSIHRIYYAPVDVLGSGSRVVIVDDLIQSGYTLASMLRLVEASGSRLQAVAAVVVVGDKWRRVANVGRVEAIAWLTP